VIMVAGRAQPIELVREYCASHGIQQDLVDQIPQNYIRYGSTLIFRLPEALQGDPERRMAEGWARVLRAKSILKIGGIITGTYRRPSMELLYGPGGDVIHREVGVRFSFDPQKIMFSKGNHPERSRISGIDMSGETVVDLFAGIGYFSLPAAISGKAERVFSCEMNPVAYDYLMKNIKLNRAHAITPPAGG